MDPETYLQLPWFSDLWPMPWDTLGAKWGRKAQPCPSAAAWLCCWKAPRNAAPLPETQQRVIYRRAVTQPNVDQTASKMRYGKKNIPNFGDAGGCHQGTRWDVKHGLSTTEGSEPSAGINEAHVLVTCAHSLVLSNLAYSHAHLCMIVCFPKEITNKNQILRFVRSSPKQHFHVAAERFTWEASTRYGFGSYKCDCAKMF